jgi:E3 ubiquitin-protein ligase DOA10
MFMKLQHNDRTNANVFSLIYLSIYFCLTCFGLSFSPSSEAGVQFCQWLKSPIYYVSARALTPDPADVNH